MHMQRPGKTRNGDLASGTGPYETMTETHVTGPTAVTQPRAVT